MKQTPADIQREREREQRRARAAWNIEEALRHLHQAESEDSSHGTDYYRDLWEGRRLIEIFGSSLGVKIV